MNRTENDIVKLAQDDHRRVVLEGNDGDLFVLNVSEVIAAGNSYIKQREKLDEVQGRVNVLWAKIKKWVKDNLDFISDAIISYHHDRFHLIVIQKERLANDTLEQSLIDLDIELAQSLEIRPLIVESLLLPYCEAEDINSFVPTHLRHSFVRQK